MSSKLEEFKKEQKRENIPDIQTGNTVRVTQKIGDKTQLFEGLVIAQNHGKDTTGTITLRKVIDKVGVEKIFPLHSPTIEKIEVVKKGKTRKSKIYYIREKSKKVVQKKIK